MRIYEAKPRIIDAFNAWVDENRIDRPQERHAWRFFGYLKKDRQNLLEFRCKGDPWQKVKSWLLHEGKITYP